LWVVAGWLSVPELPADSPTAALGFTADLGPLVTWSIEIVDRRIVGDTAMRTCRPRSWGSRAVVANNAALSSICFQDANSRSATPAAP
jgi:hypothetical protein